MLYYLFACAPSPSTDTALAPAPDLPGVSPTLPGTTPPGTEDPPGGTTTSDPTVPPPPAPVYDVPTGGVVMVAGGGSEGDIGDYTAWSAAAYATLIEAGDVNGDGLVLVAVLSVWEESDWVPSYFEWLGADDAFNVEIASIEAASDPAVVDALATADAMYLKGGDQGAYYDRWNGTPVEDAVLAVHALGGGVGGTSAGAASMSEIAIAGSYDVYSLDLLRDATHVSMEDWSDGPGSVGLKNDFLPILPDAVVDTHFTERARLGRLAVLLGYGRELYGDVARLGIGVEQQTALVVRGPIATVIGKGSVTFLADGLASTPLREAGSPPGFTDLGLDVLVQGWSYDLSTRTAIIDTAPETARAVVPTAPPPVTHAIAAAGSMLSDEPSFGIVAERWPDPWAVVDSTVPEALPGALGFLDTLDTTWFSERAGVNFEGMASAMAEVAEIGPVTFMLPVGARLVAEEGAPHRLAFETEDGEAPTAALVIDGSALSWVDHSEVVSWYDDGSGALHAGTLVGATLHLVAESHRTGLVWDHHARAMVP